MNDQQASIAARIAELSSLPMAELWIVWDRHFSSRPINPNRAFVESRVAYKLQEDAVSQLNGHRNRAVFASWPAILRFRSPAQSKLQPQPTGWKPASNRDDGS